LSLLTQTPWQHFKPLLHGGEQSPPPPPVVAVIVLVVVVAVPPAPVVLVVVGPIPPTPVVPASLLEAVELPPGPESTVTLERHASASGAPRPARTQMNKARDQGCLTASPESHKWPPNNWLRDNSRSRSWSLWKAPRGAK